MASATEPLFSIRNASPQSILYFLQILRHSSYGKSPFLSSSQTLSGVYWHVNWKYSFISLSSMFSFDNLFFATIFCSRTNFVLGKSFNANMAYLQSSSGQLSKRSLTFSASITTNSFMHWRRCFMNYFNIFMSCSLRNTLFMKSKTLAYNNVFVKFTFSLVELVYII